MRAEQIRYALIARVLRAIERAASTQDHQAAVKTHGIIGRLEYAHYEGACFYALDACVEKLGGAR